MLETKMENVSLLNLLDEERKNINCIQSREWSIKWLNERKEKEEIDERTFFSLCNYDEQRIEQAKNELLSIRKQIKEYFEMLETI